LKWVIDSHLIFSSLLTAKEAFLNSLLTIFAHIVTFNHDEMVTNHDEMVTPANRLLSFSVAE
jgi:hypothetical protein